MIKLSPGAAKTLKAVHIFCITLWIGGLVTWLPLLHGMPLHDRVATQTTYMLLRAIAWNVIGWGGITSFFSGLLTALLTPWGLWRHNWVRIKLFATIGMVLLGMFYTERKMLANLTLLEGKERGVLTSAAFLENHRALLWIVPVQLAFFFLIVLLSVQKPWMRKTSAQLS